MDLYVDGTDFVEGYWNKVRALDRQMTDSLLRFNLHIARYSKIERTIDENSDASEEVQCSELSKNLFSQEKYNNAHGGNEMVLVMEYMLCYPS